MKDKYIQRVKEKFEQRSQTGIKKYGTTLGRGDIDLLGWLNHLQEELMDATAYIERLKEESRLLIQKDVKKHTQESKTSFGKQNKTIKEE